MKYHVSNLSGQWIVEHGPTRGICKEMSLFCVGACSREKGDKPIRMEDRVCNHIEELTCMTWLAGAVERLIQATMLYVSCSWEDLQSEVCDFSDATWESASLNVQRRPTAVSRYGTVQDQDDTIKY